MDGIPPADLEAAGPAPYKDPRAANALRHGLAASKALPPDLAATARELREAFFEELRPASPLQQFLVEEISRHAAAMKHAGDYEAAVLRAAHKQAGALEELLGVDSQLDPDDQIAAMITSASVEGATRYRRCHERAFYASLDRLRDSQNECLNDALGQLRFESAKACEDWLAGWQREQSWVCPHCGGRERSWLRKRGGWECGCGKQFSLRHGTVYAASHVTLQQWFNAVLQLVADRNLTTSMLCGRIGLSRRGTVGHIMKQIRNALIAQDASSRLAGLNDLVVDYLEEVAQNTKQLQNKSVTSHNQPGQGMYANRLIKHHEPPGLTHD